MRFEFATAARIVFGAGTLKQIGPIAAELGRRAFVVTGLPPALTQPVLTLLAEQGIECATFPVTDEPTLTLVRAGVAQLQLAACDLVIGLGGGSAIDTGKAIAGLATNGGDPLDYVEVIGKGRTLAQPSAPYVAIPTTAGTGAEVTRNAVLASPEHRVKVSLRSPHLLPRVALVDPELTYSLPPDVTASTGLDALTQLVEPFVSIRANPLTDAFCREGLHRAARSLRPAYEQGSDAPAQHGAVAREDMSLASLLGGLALANAGLGAVHGIASVVGGMFSAPHGAVCARLLPHVMQVNVRALKARRAENAALRRYDEIAHILTGNHQARAPEGVAWVTDLCGALHVPPLAAYGMTQDDVAVVVERSLVASSTQGNPLPLTPGEMASIVLQAL
jgi:alcohol dehydrogenase class IV